MKRKFVIAGIVIGALLALGPLWGSLGVFFGMQRAFTVLGGSGISDPRALSSTIGAVLFWETVGVIACPVGLAVCIFSIFKLQAMHRSPPPLPSSKAPEFKE